MIFSDKTFLRFIIVFTAVFLLCYFGALFFTGLAVPGGNYSPFVDKYFDVAAVLRTALIYFSKWVLGIFGTETYRADEYVLRAVSGKGIRLVYSCLGFGVMSFWAAYSVAMSGNWMNKAKWLAGGLLIIFFINTARISLVLQAANRGWDFPFGWDHHTWFNIVSYIFILLMIFWHQHITSKIADE
ncbi:MAG: exosortase/archaeosortase family protein [Ferruginibacter sp.]